jgi:hypothetical protein
VLHVRYDSSVSPSQRVVNASWLRFPILGCAADTCVMCQPCLRRAVNHLSGLHSNEGSLLGPLASKCGDSPWRQRLP